MQYDQKGKGISDSNHSVLSNHWNRLSMQGGLVAISQASNRSLFIYVLRD